METPIAEAPEVLTASIAREIEKRFNGLTRFAGPDHRTTPARFRKPFSATTWSALPEDIRIKHLRARLTETVIAERQEKNEKRRAARAAKEAAALAELEAAAHAEEAAALAASPAPRPVARFVALCHSCGKEIPVHTPAPRVQYCRKHEPKSLPKHVDDNV